MNVEKELIAHAAVEVFFFFFFPSYLLLVWSPPEMVLPLCVIHEFSAKFAELGLCASFFDVTVEGYAFDSPRVSIADF